MPKDETDVLEISRGSIVAPAGCGKTQLVADALRRHLDPKPILVLTHTNAGVSALRSRLEARGVARSAYRLHTLDGWALRLISTFPARAGHALDIVEGSRPDYPAIRKTTHRLLKAGHIGDVLRASYSRLLVDEYQDCSIGQHAIVYQASTTVPTCVLGDPVQAIFDFDRNDPLADWEKHVCARFPVQGELRQPWRWINAGTEPLGEWLLDVRAKLTDGIPLDLRNAPEAVDWIELSGDAEDHQRRLDAARSSPSTKEGRVLIIGESTSPARQRRMARQTPGAVAMEAVDLRDLVEFAGGLDLSSDDALAYVANFAQMVMTNVGAADLVRRVRTLERGRAQKAPSSVEKAALSFRRSKCHAAIVDLLVEINKEGAVRAYRPALLRCCIRALQMCDAENGLSLEDAAIRVREQQRIHGRALPRRAVGSTLLLKGLEAEVAVILHAEALNARNLYVAMTRASERIVVCSSSPVLNPRW